MVRLFMLAVMGALAPVLLVGAIPSVIVLMAAPPAFIYVFAFIALTPLCGVVVWRVAPPLRNSEALAELVNRFGSGDLIALARIARRPDRLISLPFDWR